MLKPVSAQEGSIAEEEEEDGTPKFAAEADMQHVLEHGTQFATCCTSTKVQVLTPEEVQRSRVACRWLRRRLRLRRCFDLLALLVQKYKYWRSRKVQKTDATLCTDEQIVETLDYQHAYVC